MSKAKTAVQVKEQIKWLAVNKEKVRRYTIFGDDNWLKIEAQITVLEEELTEDDIYDRSDEEGEETGREWNWVQRESALSACHWRDGEDDEAEPIKNWKALIPHATDKRKK